MANQVQFITINVPKDGNILNATYANNVALANSIKIDAVLLRKRNDGSRDYLISIVTPQATVKDDTLYYSRILTKINRGDSSMFDTGIDEGDVVNMFSTRIDSTKSSCTMETIVIQDSVT